MSEWAECPTYILGNSDLTHTQRLTGVAINSRCQSLDTAADAAMHAAVPVQVEGVAPNNHSSFLKTRLNDLSYGLKIWTDFSSVLSQSTSLTDGQTESHR